ncbi:anhydro-N-acetylmuramic acid kinase [Candidatus Pelagibacter sp.]|nr:anhydro-N-acetylmuramic acid kinase [Candidatus Pelagibacter sp.]
MEKIYTSLGLMSGTSMDGVDASIIRSNGEDKYEVVFNQYFEYDKEIYDELVYARNKVNSSKDLEIHSTLLEKIEKKITLFHASIYKKVINNYPTNIDLIGFHGQTIFHNANKKISKQIGDANLLSALVKKKVVYNFRENDIKNGGQGAPLAPIFHQLLVNQNKIPLPTCIINIGGIANISIILSKNFNDLKSFDIGPGNCLLDEWTRKNSKEKFDKNGEWAKSGKTDEIILNQAIDNFYNIKDNSNLSFDIKDFDLSFVRGLSLKDGLSTLTDFTAYIIYQSIINSFDLYKDSILNIIICGGGRKNLSLMDKIKKKIASNMTFSPIDDFKVDGDFIESQAFAYLAIRSYLNKTISFPKTTNVGKPCSGGVLIENY